MRTGNHHLAIAAIVFFLLMPVIAHAAWWDGTFSYRIPVVNGISSCTWTNGTQMLTLDADDFTSLQADCDDIRVTDANPVTETNLSFSWVNRTSAVIGCGTHNMTVMVRRPVTSNNTFYVYSGNATAPDASSQPWVGETLGFWPLMGDRGDKSATGNDFLSGASFDPISPDNRHVALNFTAGDTVDAAAVVEPQRYTIGAWIKWSPTASNADGHVFLNRGAQGMVEYCLNNVGGTLWGCQQYATCTDGAKNTANIVPVLSIGEWHWIGVMFNGTDIFQIQDGVIGAATACQAPVIYDATAFSLGGNAAQGKRLEASLMSVVAIDRAMNQSEIHALMNATRPSTAAAGTEEPYSPLSITMPSPLNSTYTTTWTLLNFTASDGDADYRCTVWKNGINLTTYNVTDSAYTSVNLTSLTNRTYNITISCEGATSGTGVTTMFFTAADWTFGRSYKASVYETNWTQPVGRAQISPNVRNTTAFLRWWDREYALTPAVLNSTAYNASVNFTIPVMAVSGSDIHANFTWQFGLNDGNYYNVTDADFTQNVLHAYTAQALNSTASVFISGQSVWMNFTVNHLLNGGSINSSILFNGITYPATLVSTTGSQYAYSALVTAPTANGTYVSTAFATLTDGILSRNFNSSFYYQVWIISLFNCSYSNDTETGYVTAFFFRNFAERNLSAVKNGIPGITLTLYPLGSTSSLTYSLNFSIANESHRICILPAWAEFQVDAIMDYSNDPALPQRSYFLNNATVNNATADINLYGLEYEYASLITITVKDINGQLLQDAIIKAERYYPASNSYFTVAMGKTGPLGTALIRLEMYDAWYKFIIEKNGVVLKEFTSMIISSTTFTLQIQAQTLSDWWTVNARATSTCRFVATNNTLQCTGSDTSGTVKEWYMKVWKQQTVGWILLCDYRLGGTSATLNCGLGNTTGASYYYRFGYAASPDVDMFSDLLNFGGNASVYASFGLFITMMIFTFLGLSGIWNPAVSLTLAGAGLIAMMWLGFMPPSMLSAVGSIIVLIAVAVWRLKS